MRQMFRAARSFNRELDKWDVRSVTKMSEMFSSATSFNQDLNSWDVSNVKDMNGMFSSSQAFNGNISDWDISGRSEEHTSELQSRGHLVCRLLLEKKKKKNER